MTRIDPSFYLSNQSRGTTGNKLGKDEFMKILMAQLQNQDPLNPLEDKEFISQMASFSSLEQMMNMTNSIEQMTKAQSLSPILQYSNLIGKEVSYSTENQESGNTEETVISQVKAVSQSDGKAVLELYNGQTINADEVLKISNPTAE